MPSTSGSYLRVLFVALMGCVVAFVVAPTTAVGQQPSASRDDAGKLSFVMRGVPLDAALEQFSDLSGETVAYESTLVSGRSVYCVIESATAERALRCLLEGSGIDYFRLSSGTIVLAASAKQSPLYGYLTGVVTDDATGEPLAEANVQLLDLGVGAATNAGGTFLLPPLVPGAYQVRISHVAYHTWSGTVLVGPGSNATTAVSLEPRTVPVQPIVVDGATGRLLSHELSAPDVRASERDIESGGVYRAAATMNGIRTNDATADLYIDGASPSEMQLRLDGAPVYLPRHSIGIIGPFSSLALGTLTVHRAGYGVRPGSLIAGVAEAEHNLSSPWSHVQADPGGINGRIKYGRPGRDRLQVMAAARVDTWGRSTPGGFGAALSAWSVADPFLLVAPTGLYQYATEEFVSDTLGLQTAIRPTVEYSDVHVAFDYHPSLLRSLSGSVYWGRQGLEGGRTTGATSFDVPPLNARSPAFSRIDDYAWQNLTGQLTFGSFVGRRTRVELQLLGSTYVMDHGYDLVDNLQLPVDLVESGALANFSVASLGVQDQNRMESAALRLTLDHVRGVHQLEAGIESRVQYSSSALRSYSAEDAQVDVGSPTREVSLASTNGVYETSAAQTSVYVEDKVTLAPSTTVTGGLRTTYLAARKRFFAEPRLALDYNGSSTGDEPNTWAARIAAGVYRQYDVQTDLSVLNAGSLLPSVRLWMPVDESIRPPLAYHAAAYLAHAPAQGWKVATNLFARLYEDVPVFDYHEGVFDSGSAQVDFLAPANGKSIGGDIELRRYTQTASLAVKYSYLYSSRQSDALFGGKSVSQPDVEPHRVSVEGLLRPHTNVVIRARWFRGWDRRWAFTRAYYDYFGHDEALRQHLDVNLGDPDAHRLPAQQSLDVGASLTHRVGPISADLRIDVVNVLDRRNVASKRLLYYDDTLVSVARPMLPRITTLTARISWLIN